MRIMLTNCIQYAIQGTMNLYFWRRYSLKRRILVKLNHIGNDILTLEDNLSAELDKLTVSVTNVNSKADSLITLVSGLAQIIRDNAGDKVAMLALANDLDAQTGEIQEAIDANTPPAPPTPTV